MGVAESCFPNPQDRQHFRERLQQSEQKFSLTINPPSCNRTITFHFHVATRIYTETTKPLLISNHQRRHSKSKSNKQFVYALHYFTKKKLYSISKDTYFLLNRKALPERQMDRMLQKSHFFNKAITVSSFNAFRGELILRGNLALPCISQRKYFM